MAWYRDLILGMGQLDGSGGETAVALQNMQTIILVSLAVLLFLGALFTFLSFDTFCAALIAGVAVLGGLGLGVMYLLLNLLDLLIARVLVFVKTIQESMAAMTEKAQHRMGGVKQRGAAMLAKLRGLVTPRQTAKAEAQGKQELIVSPSPVQE
ncbi:MAG: hypothetical protein AB7P69_11365 [Candidatus Binatia bacterium]